MTWELILDAFIDAANDNLRMLPFLFAAFLLLEAAEHYTGSAITRMFSHKKAGPLVGGVLGCIPQCGFSLLASNLYCGGMITLGTLLAVYLSTSDEAVLIFMAHPGQGATVLRLLGVKLIIAVFAGYLVDFLYQKRIHAKKHAEDLCEHCGCHDHSGILLPALNHTLRLFFFLFLFTSILNVLLETMGLEQISRLLLQNSVLQPFFTALIGLIPNCASSVLIAELYLQGALSFGSAVAGLCSGAGVGLAVLAKTNNDKKESIFIFLLLYGIAVLAGLILQLIF